MRTQLKENETPIVTVRKHWFVLLRPVLATTLLLAAAVAAALAGAGTEFANIILAGAGIMIVLTILWLIYWILDRYKNLWTVTDLRVIDEYGVFTLNSKETPLDKINNISYRQPLLGRLFNYGDVQIQSAAEAGATIHKMVASPRLLKDTITQYQEHYRQWQITDQARSLANVFGNGTPSSKKSISDEITKLHALKEKGIITEDEFRKMKDKLLNDWQQYL